MITEDYVSFEIAKLLREKGFDEETEYIYSNNGELLRLNHFGIKDLTNTDCNGYHTWQFPIEGVASIISAPTLQMAMKWLREVHNLHIEFVRGKGYYHGHIEDAETGHPIAGVVPLQETYEECAEESIKYCLKNLI